MERFDRHLIYGVLFILLAEHGGDQTLATFLHILAAANLALAFGFAIWDVLDVIFGEYEEGGR